MTMTIMIPYDERRADAAIAVRNSPTYFAVSVSVRRCFILGASLQCSMALPAKVEMDA